MDHVADFSIGDVIKVHSSQLVDFKRIATKNSEKKRYRLCLQDSPNNRLHEMFLCRTYGDYTRPDKHINCSESHTIIEGREAVILFSDEGVITDVFILDRDSDYLSYRINGAIYHMTIPLSEVAIDYEVKLGPFRPSSNIFPDWAPDGKDQTQSARFLREIKAQVKEKWKLDF